MVIKAVNIVREYFYLTKQMVSAHLYCIINFNLSLFYYRRGFGQNVACHMRNVQIKLKSALSCNEIVAMIPSF